MTARLHPREYTGERLCACCGYGEGTGKRYLICADPDAKKQGLTCDDTCSTYYLNEELWCCDSCEQVFSHNAEREDKPT